MTIKRHRVRYRDPDGRQCAPCFKTKSQALAHKTDIENRLRSGTYLVPESKEVTVETYGARWLDKKGDVGTLAQYERHLRLHVNPILGDRVVARLNAKDIRDFVKCLDAGSTYGESIFTTLATMLTAAVDDGLLGTNPCWADSVQPVKPRARRGSPVSRRVHVWTDEKTSAVIRALPKRYRAKGAVGVGSGLRPAELIGVSPDDLDPEGGWVNVVRQVQWVPGHGWCFKLPKGGKVRRSPLSDGLVDVLALHAEEFPPAEVVLPWYDPDARADRQFRKRSVRLMFTTPQMRVVSSKVFNADVWKPALVQAGVMPDTPGPGATKYAASPENGVRMLRHIFATRQIEAGESPVDVADWLGHQDPQITFDRYVHGRNDAGDRGSRAVDAFLSATLRVPTPRNRNGSDHSVLSY
ncbi:site-specific integrase [Streptomyces xanthophaeus]|nr:tyrosine-type recombinase/integrase [Streptomyces xanthophaeus]